MDSPGSRVETGARKSGSKARDPIRRIASAPNIVRTCWLLLFIFCCPFIAADLASQLCVLGMRSPTILSLDD
jgi:hypothetical protein